MTRRNCAWTFIWTTSTLISSSVGVKLDDMKPVTVTSGVDKATLPCAYFASTPDGMVNVRWSLGSMQGPTVIIQQFSGQLYQGELYRGRVGLESNCTLSINKPRESDSGNYTCSILVPSDPITADSKSVQLSVLAKSRELPPESEGSSESGLSTDSSFSIILWLPATLMIIFIVVSLLAVYVYTRKRHCFWDAEKQQSTNDGEGRQPADEKCKNPSLLRIHEQEQLILTMGLPQNGKTTNAGLLASDDRGIERFTWT